MGGIREVPFMFCSRSAHVILVGALVLSIAAPATPAAPAAPDIDYHETVQYPVAGWVGDMVVGPDGALWFSIDDRDGDQPNSVGRITMAGSVTTFPLDAGHAVARLAPGLDGNVWFTDGPRVARITPTGTAQTVALPAGGCPFALASGPDGRVWFTEPCADKVGRIGPTGNVREWTTPSPLGRVSDVTAGPDGNVWFTEASNIGRITPDGVITEFPPYGASAGIQGDTSLVVGWDGRLWFPNSDGVVAATVAGSSTRYPTGAQYIVPERLGVGHDGSIWFPVWEELGTLFSVDPGGAITSVGFVDPDNGNGWTTGAVVAAPDGNLWVAGDGVISRVRTAETGTGYVSVRSHFFAPSARHVALGHEVHWTFFGPQKHTVTDLSGLGLYNSGGRGFVSEWVRAFPVAGTWPYGCTRHATERGTIRVPVYVSPRSGSEGTTFGVVWSKSTAPPVGTVYDVEVDRPGPAGWAAWKTGVGYGSGRFVPDAGVGEYRFRARLRRPANGAASGWSPASAISVA
jgi:virginiamycin B lyase